MGRDRQVALVGAFLWLLLAGAGAAWWYWTADATDRPVSAVPATERTLAIPPSATTELAFWADADRRAESGQHAAHAATAEPKPPSDRKWEAVRRYCPWPPLPSAWQVLDEPCLTAMNALGLDEHLVDDARGWREVLADPVGTRRAVAEAMDRPECRVPPSSDRSGETRSDLRGACAAEAMLRLASLQDKCVERLHTDWESLYTVSMPTVDRISDSQEEYYRLVESERQARAHNLWRTHMCRTVPEAFEWIEALPVPPGDPTAHRWVGLPPITQALDLYAAARRFGLGIPERAIRQLKILAESAEREEKWREQLLAEPEIEWTF